jgi:hypothetical protein
MTGMGTPSIQSKIPRPIVVSSYAGVACSLSIRGTPRGAPVRRTRRTLLRRRCLLIVDPGVSHPRWFQGLLEGGVLERTPCFACSAACCVADSLGASVAVSGFNFVSSLAVSGPLDFGSVAVSG